MMTGTIQPIDLLIILIELVLLYTAYRITVQQDIRGVIAAYRGQSYFLAATTGLTAIVRLQDEATQDLGFTLFLFVLVILLPLLLGRLIEPILARATVSESYRNNGTSQAQPLTLRRLRVAIFSSPQQIATARRAWIGQGRKPRPGTNLIFVVLLSLAALIAFAAFPGLSQSNFGPPGRFGLFVSLVLHLVGLFNTTIKGDIISQAIGVLTMDQGLYLAVVKIVAVPVPATLFVVSLYAYTLITITLLFVIMPRLRHEFGSIDLDEITKRSELKG